MSRRTFPKWLCAGCQKHHDVHRWIEGENHAGRWCLTGIRRAVKEGRNDAPHHTEVHGPRFRAA
jgi:hypothetical protein